MALAGGGDVVAGIGRKVDEAGTAGRSGAIALELHRKGASSEAVEAVPLAARRSKGEHWLEQGTKIGKLERPEGGATSDGIRTRIGARLGFCGGWCHRRVDREFGKRCQRQRRRVGQGGSGHRRGGTEQAVGDPQRHRAILGLLGNRPRTAIGKVQEQIAVHHAERGVGCDQLAQIDYRQPGIDARLGAGRRRTDQPIVRRSVDARDGCRAVAR